MRRHGRTATKLSGPWWSLILGSWLMLTAIVTPARSQMLLKCEIAFNNDPTARVG